MRNPAKSGILLIVVVLLILSLFAACDVDDATTSSTPISTVTTTVEPARIQTPASTPETMPQPKDLALVYDVSYASEKTLWTVSVIEEETIDGTECYVIDALIEGEPERLRLQGEMQIDLKPTSETYWRSKETFDPVKTEASVISFGTMQVNTPRTFTFSGAHGIPFAVDNSWTYDVLAEPSMGQPSTSTWNVEVIGTEEITLPAGTFDCYVVEHTKLAVNDIAEENSVVGKIEWWSTDNLFLNPVKTIDHSTYAESEIRELASYAKAIEPEKTPDVEVISDTERLTSGQAWEDFCDSLKSAGDIIMNPTLSVTEQDQAEGYRHLLRLLWVAMNELVENDDPLRPYLTRYPNVPTKIGHDNPDNVYSGGPIQGDQTYRVTGTIGTNIFTSFNVYSGFIGFDPYKDLRTISSLNSEDMEINPDGTFEIILSPDPHPGNWMKLEPDAKMLVVRKLFYDWKNEIEGNLQITNLNMEGTTSESLTAEEMAGQLDDVARFVESVANFFVGSHNAKFTSGDIPVNTLPPPTFGRMSMADPYNQTQFGHFKLEPGEALMVEFPITDCLYTNFELGNMWWESLDYRTRQTHLNGFMSYLNDDGIYRYVVCPEDPGVPNWLDTEGRLEGTMFLRWTYCEEASDAITTRVVQFDEIWDYMPNETPHISLEERAVALVKRQATVNQRYRP